MKMKQGNRENFLKKKSMLIYFKTIILPVNKNIIYYLRQV